MKQILLAFGLDSTIFEINRFGSGHINDTYLLFSPSTNEKFILQKINTSVFSNPKIIAENINSASQFLNHNHPEYLFIHERKTITGENIFEENKNYWRLSPFIKNSYSIDTVSKEEMAFEAAKAFGLFVKNLNGMPLDGLKPSIPDFHNLSWRFKQFEEALENGNMARIKEEKEEINFFLNHRFLIIIYENIISNPNYPTRMIHHDTKINNVLFDLDTNQSICVCDLDTLMPGKIISDFGDIVRTYTSVESEESTNFENVKIRIPFFKALTEGYLNQLKNLLSAEEKANLFFAGPFMIYMQGLRFLTDYLNNDTYYPIKYPKHNLNRAINQRFLLVDILKKENELREIIDQSLK